MSAWCGQKQSLLGIDEEEDMGGSIVNGLRHVVFSFFYYSRASRCRRWCALHGRTARALRKGKKEKKRKGVTRWRVHSDRRPVCVCCPSLVTVDAFGPANGSIRRPVYAELLASIPLGFVLVRALT